jgi:putative hemolysin
MPELEKGRYRCRIAETPEELRRAQRLRQQCFRPGAPGHDADAFDARCRHFLVEETGGGQLVCCFRILPLRDGRAAGQSYSAQFYDLSALAGLRAPLVEMGRFCVDPDWRDPDILRIAWGALTQYIDARQAEMLIGCSSFRGTDPRVHADAFALLGARHQAPRHWRPRIKAPRVVPFGIDGLCSADPARAMRCMPPLLRTYLLMGGWVSDHAVIDDALGTLHVFTGLEIGAIPPARQRLLRAVAS